MKLSESSVLRVVDFWKTDWNVKYPSRMIYIIIVNYSTYLYLFRATKTNTNVIVIISRIYFLPRQNAASWSLPSLQTGSFNPLQNAMFRIHWSPSWHLLIDSGQSCSANIIIINPIGHGNVFLKRVHGKTSTCQISSFRVFLTN